MMKFPLSSALFLASGFTLCAQDKAAEKITYVDHVRPLLENKCFSCHNPDKKKGDLDLTSFAGAMAGGGSGSVVNAGDPDGSKLIASVLKKEEPFMPPEGAPMGAKDIEVLHKWIQGGLLETASSVAKKAAPKANLALASAPTGKPDGPPPMPENVLLEPVVVAPRGTVITAMAASPWAPVVAVSGAHQALIYDAATRSLAGVYPYPEGYIRSLKFSQNGSLLIAGGGRGGKSGNAVIWDVKTGRRVTEVGHEFDQVMGADISPNQAMIAIGSPSKKVKCFNASTGEELYVIKKHTEWVLQIAFSPDGVLLASADRNGGIIITEAATGGEFYVLDGHKASCTGLAWRSDSNILASCSEDGKIAVWEMQGGKQVKSWAAHGPGVEHVSFTPDGKIISCGRDGVARLWDINGNKLGETKPETDILTKVAGISDSKTIAVGDWQGNVHFYSTTGMAELGVVSSNPSPIAQRIADSERFVNEIAAQVTASDESVKRAEANVQGKETQLAEAKKKLVDAALYRDKLTAELNDYPNKLAALQKQSQEALQKRNAQADAIKRYQQAAEQMKQLETSLASLNAEKAKLTAPEQAPQLAENGRKIAETSAKLEGLKKSSGSAPQAIADFDKAIKDLQDQITAFNNAKPGKQKELENVKKVVADAPKGISDAEKQLADAKASVDTQKKNGVELRAQAAWAQKQPTFLRAAQFNVTLLDEKQKLERLESDVKGLQEFVKEGDEAKTAATQRIEASKKTVAESSTKLPALEAAAAKLRTDLPAVEKSLEPLRQEEAQTAAKLVELKKTIADKEAELNAINQELGRQTGVAQKAAKELAQQAEALQKQIAEVNTKLAAPQKVQEAKKPELAKVETELAEAGKPLPELEKTLEQVTAKFDAANQANTANGSDPNIKTAFESAKHDHDAAQGAVDKVKALMQAKQKAIADLKGEIATAEKAAAPLREQLGKLSAQAEALKKSLAEKTAAIAAVEKDLGAKAQPVSVALAQSKAGLETSTKQYAAVREKIAATTKSVEAKRAELAKAQTDLDAGKQAAAAAQKALDAATKEIADKDKALGEAKADLAKNEPQLEPQRAKVKQMTDKFLAMLPK